MLRLPQHYVSLPESIGVDVILGKNGFIWVTRTIPVVWRQQEEAAAGVQGGAGVEDGGGVPLAEILQNLQLRHNSTPLLRDERTAVVRVRNCIAALANRSQLISPDSIIAAYNATLHLHPKVCIFGITKKNIYADYLITYYGRRLFREIVLILF